MVSSNNPVNPTHVKGWIFDVYPSAFGEITIWIIGENGERFRLIDKFHPKIYVSGRAEDIERLASQFFSSKLIESWNFVYKYARTTDNEKRKVLEIELRDCRKISVITRNVLKMGDYSLYEVHNCNLHGDQHYLFTHDLFPLALVEVETERTGLRYTLRDSVESVNYVIPPLRITKLHVEVAKRKKIAKLNEPISQIVLTQDNTQEMITHGEEGDKLLQLVKLIKRLDPDIILTSGGDAHLFPYLIHRAKINNVLNELIINRENRSLAPRRLCGRTFFSYGRTYYRAPTTRLFGRVHIDERNTFTLRDCGFEGLIEIARICRTPLHTASRSSIGSSMSALQFYQAIKDEVLIPRNKSIPEAFKSAYELLVGDRGGFIYEPQVGIHDWVSEVDFASMYPSLMAKNNISAETVLCKCCIESPLRIPELNYNICKRRVGIVPKTLKFVIGKRLLYKCLKEKTRDSSLKEVYNRRQTALKWILVTCFGYLGYRNAKFGTVDGHLGVCAFGRDTFFRAARISERLGFTVIHGIIDSLWLKKEGTTISECKSLCREVSDEIGVPLNFEGRYKWIVFLPSKIHPRIGVLNRYYGVMENGKIKVRGLEVRKRDTPRLIYDAQMEMIKALAVAENSEEFFERIPKALEITQKYRRRLLDREVPICDLIVKKHLSKHPKNYKQQVSQVIAAKQLMREGVEVHAGKNISFLFTNAIDKRHERRVKAELLIEKGERADVKKYLHLLYAATANLLSFSGYTNKSVQEAVIGLHFKSLLEYQV